MGSGVYHLRLLHGVKVLEILFDLLGVENLIYFIDNDELFSAAI